jgi:hypothetical protein
MTKVEIREAIATIDAELERLEQAHDHRFDALKSAPLDSWIALSEDESKIAAIGSSHDETVRKSESGGVSDPVLAKTPKVWLPISV